MRFKIMIVAMTVAALALVTATLASARNNGRPNLGMTDQ